MLPNPGQDAVPFTPLTAEFYDDTIENIESLATGVGLDDGSILSRHIGASEVEGSHIDFTTFSLADILNGATKSSVNTNQTTTSTSFADLATSGPAATVTIGSSGKALVFIRASFLANVSQYTLMGVAVSGSSTVAANDNDGITANGTRTEDTLSCMLLFTGLTAGSNTFTAKYRVTGGTGSYQKRAMIVIPL